MEYRLLCSVWREKMKPTVKWAKEYLEYLEFKRVNNIELFGADFALDDLAKAILKESEDEAESEQE